MPKTIRYLNSAGHCWYKLPANDIVQLCNGIKYLRPVNDCSHYTAALKMLSRSKFSDSTKKGIHSCITRRGKTLGCIKKEKSDIGLTEAEINDIISLEIFNETRALVEQSIKNPGLELVLAKKCV